MGFSGSDGRCKKHPKHRQSPGVCSHCLRERLSRLSVSSSSKVTSTSSCSTSYASSSSSSLSSPYTPDRPSRLAFDRKTDDRMLFFVSRDGLVDLRSRSTAFLTGQSRVRDEAGRGNSFKDLKKKRGFWSKLIRGGGNRGRELNLHSKTVK